jgi:hypothetical protein
MVVIKRAQIPSGALKLKQLKNDTNLSNNQYKYVVEYPDGDRTDPRFTKQAGLQEFRRVRDHRQQGFGSGFGIDIPGLGRF